MELFLNMVPQLHYFPFRISRCPLMMHLLSSPLTTVTNASNSGELEVESVCELIKQGKLNHPVINELLSSASAPVLLSRVLLNLKHFPIPAFSFFNFAKSRISVNPPPDSFCVLAHILFFTRKYSQASDILKELILSFQRSQVVRVFDELWCTRNTCMVGYGVFDALFSCFIDLGMLEEACQCFEKMKPFRVLPKVRSCNLLLHKLSITGGSSISMKFFKTMKKAAIFSPVSYNMMIGVMGKEGDVSSARNLFLQMKQAGLKPDTFTYNSLLDAYGKAGLLDDVRHLFDEMTLSACKPDVVTYNSLIKSFCKHDTTVSAFKYFGQMKKKALKPNVVTYSTLIDALCKDGTMKQALKFFVDMVRVGIAPNEFTYTCLIDAYCKLGNLTEAFNLASDMSKRSIALNVVTFTTLVDGLCKNGRSEEADKIFTDMKKAGVPPNEKTYTSLIYGWFKSKNREKAFTLVKEMKEKGLSLDLFLYGALSWRLNDAEECQSLLDTMKKSGLNPNPVIYTILIDSFFKGGSHQKAIELFEEMCSSKMEITMVTFCVLIDGLFKAGLVDDAMKHYKSMGNFKLQPNVAVYTAVLDGLCKSNRLEEATEVYEEMQRNDLNVDKVAYSAMMDGNLKHGKMEEGLNISRIMKWKGMKMDKLSYTSLVWGLSSCGNLELAKEFLFEMIGCGIIPDDVLVGCILQRFHAFGDTDGAAHLQNQLLEKGLLKYVY